MNSIATAMVRLGVLVFALAAVLAPAVVTAQARVDLFDKKSDRTGGVIVNERSGRVDVYDRDAKRVGYGQLDRATGRVDLYDVQGNRIGNITLTPSGAIRQEGR